MGGKQKVVMRVPLGDDKSRSKALETVAGVPGIISVSLEGADKNQVVVIGDEIDSICLTVSLRKKLRLHVELVTVAPVEEKKDAQQKKPEKKDSQQKKTEDTKDGKDNKNPINPTPYCQCPTHVLYVSDCDPFSPPCGYNHPSLCSIL